MYHNPGIHIIQKYLDVYIFLKLKIPHGTDAVVEEFLMRIFTF